MVGRSEIVRRSLDAFNRRDVEALLADADEQVEWRPGMTGSLEGRVYKGRAGLERYFADLDEFLEGIEIAPLDSEEFADGVVVGIQTHIRGRASGVEIDQPTAAVFWFEGGKVSRVQAFIDPADAWRAAGVAGG